MGIETSGLRQLSADIGKATVKAAPLARAAVAKTAHDIEATAKALAPVDTGNLRGSISSDVHAFSAEIGPTAEYGAYVEEGTSRMAPQPYMNPAADRHEPDLGRAVDQIITQSLM